MKSENDFVVNSVQRVMSSPKRKRKQAMVRRVVAVVLIVSGFSLAYYFYTQYAALARTPSSQAQEQVQALVARVGKLMMLPAETPTVATVTDASKIRSQKFFENAQDGDKVLAYQSTMEAILYRPSINKIIAVAPIVVDSSQQ